MFWRCVSILAGPALARTPGNLKVGGLLAAGFCGAENRHHRTGGSLAAMEL